MIYKQTTGPYSSSSVKAKYQFIKPIQLRIQKKDNSTELIGYGIGDIIEIMEPGIHLLVCCYEKLEKIPLCDGSFIIEVPDELEKSVRRI